MECIYEMAVSSVINGLSFNVDFHHRSCKIDGKYIIKNGEYDGYLGVEPCDELQCLSTIEHLYHLYKNSVPSERSESRSRKYFYAVPECEMSDDDMMFGERRDKAQIELELYLLCQIILGFKWNHETMGTWFWQSKSDKNLVILREWIEPTNN